MKNIPTFEEFVNESQLTNLFEEHMSNLDILAQEAKDFQDFIKAAHKEYPQLKKEKDVEKWLKTIYDNVVNEADELPGSVHMKLGPKQGRLVVSDISGDPELILNSIRGIDKTARVEYYEKTGKIVGVITVSKLKDIKKNVSSFNPPEKANLEIKKKATLTKI